MEKVYTISEIQTGLKKKVFKAADLVDIFLKRIEENERINSFITVSAELAHKQAKEADRLIQEQGEKAFEDKPLLGTVVSYKDLFLTKGLKTTAGSKVLEDYFPQYSATVVSRLEKAGAICIGKNNCDAWAHGASGENSDFGPTLNPWNLSFVPGGSSSGAAAAVACGLTSFSMGTDTGGSIRQPANFCAVVGFKPTYGSVSRYGVIAMASSLDSIGHFTKTVEDSRRVFSLTKGEDGFDSTLKNADNLSSKPRLRIGVPKEYFIGGLEKEVEEAVTKAIEVYRKLGMEIKEVNLPHTKYAISVYYIIQPAEVSSNLSRYDGVRFGKDRSAFGDEAIRRIMLGSYVLSAGYYDAFYLKAMKVRSKIIEDFDMVFNEVDALIAPVSPTPPFKLGEKSDDPLKMYLADIYTVAANLAGIPGLALPFGFTKENLPLGFQLLGPRFSEDILFDLGDLFEKETGYQPVNAAEK